MERSNFQDFSCQLSCALHRLADPAPQLKKTLSMKFGQLRNSRELAPRRPRWLPALSSTTNIFEDLEADSSSPTNEVFEAAGSGAAYQCEIPLCEEWGETSVLAMIS